MNSQHNNSVDISLIIRFNNGLSPEGLAAQEILRTRSRGRGGLSNDAAREQTEHLVRTIRQGLSSDALAAQREIILQSEWFVNYLVRSESKGYHDEDGLADLRQEAYVALTYALLRFDPEAGNRFETYAEHSIRGAIRTYLGTTEAFFSLPRSTMEPAVQARAFIRDELAQGNPEPDVEAVAEYLGVDVQRADEILSIPVKFNLAHGRDDDEDLSPVLSDLADNSSAAPEELHVRDEHSRNVLAAIESLPDKYSFPLKLHFGFDDPAGEGRTYAEIGQVLGISAMGAHKRVSRALELVRPSLAVCRG